MYLSSLFCSLISLSLFSIILPSDLLPDVVPQCQGGNGRCLIRVLEAVLTSGGVYHILSTSPDFGPRACSVVSLPACRASLDNSLSLFHASSPFLDCRKLGGASKLLPQVCVTLSCVESILHLSTPQRPKACCEAAHFPRARHRRFPCALTVWVRRTLASWSLLGLFWGCSTGLLYPCSLTPHWINWRRTLNSFLGAHQCLHLLSFWFSLFIF